MFPFCSDSMAGSQAEQRIHSRCKDATTLVIAKSTIGAEAPVYFSSMVAKLVLEKQEMALTSGKRS
jgi:hypothetical protein